MLNGHAKECQDLVVASLFECKKNRTYLEVGGCWPVKHNNTYMLEAQLDWKGVSLELDNRWIQQWSARRNPCLNLDATTVNYTEILEAHNMPYNIDFLQMDIEPGPKTFEAMQRIDLTKYKFGFIAFEHDYYSEMYHEKTDLVRPASREFFLDHGYTLMTADVHHGDICFEDWWIHEDLMINDRWKAFNFHGKRFNAPDLSKEIRNLFENFLGDIRYNTETHCCKAGAHG